MADFDVSIIGQGKFASIDQLLETFHLAASRGDPIGYFGCFDVKGRFFGTDATENWSAEEFFQFSKPHFHQGGWTYTPSAIPRKISYFPSEEMPSIALFDELVVSADFHLTCRGTGSTVLLSYAL
jgi:hypothetical protein